MDWFSLYWRWAIRFNMAISHLNAIKDEWKCALKSAPFLFHCSSAIKAMLLRCETVKVAIKTYQIKRMSSRAFYLEISAWRYGIIVKTITICEQVEEHASAPIEWGRKRVREASPPFIHGIQRTQWNTEIPIQRRCMVCLRDAIFIKISSFGLIFVDAVVVVGVAVSIAILCLSSHAA